MTTTLIAGNRAVIINEQESGHVWACLYVNVRAGIAHADITALRFKGTTMAGAMRWAKAQLV